MRLDQKRIPIDVGTRPEAIKVAPSLRALQGTATHAEAEVCVTREQGQLQGKAVVSACGWHE